MARGPLPQGATLRWALEHLSQLNSVALGLVRRDLRPLLVHDDEATRQIAENGLVVVATHLTLIEHDVEIVGPVQPGLRPMQFRCTADGKVIVVDAGVHEEDR